MDVETLSEALIASSLRQQFGSEVAVLEQLRDLGLTATDAVHANAPVMPLLAQGGGEPAKKRNFVTSDAGYTLVIFYVGPTEYWFSVTERWWGLEIDINKALAQKLKEDAAWGGGAAGAASAASAAAAAAGVIATPAGAALLAAVAALGIGLAAAIQINDWCCGVKILVLPGGPAGTGGKTYIMVPRLCE